MNFVDRAVSYFSPLAGAKRSQARLIIKQNERKYEGASRGTKRTKNWHTTNMDANTELAGDLYTLRNRSRDLIRNSPYARRARDIMVSNVVGAGIIPQSKNASIDKTFVKWGDSTEIDASGVHNFYGLQALVMNTWFESGECFIRKRYRRKNSKLTVPLQYQILEPDYVDHLKTETLENGEEIIQGIHFNADGTKKGYWVFDRHPGDYYGNSKLGWVSEFMSADEIIHVFKPTRPGQVRGVPELHAVMNPLKDLSDLIDAELIRHKTATLFAGFIHDMNADEYEDEEESELADGIAPGTMEILPPGKDVKFSNPPVPEGLEAAVRVHLRQIASGLNIPYEELSGDLSNTNFSSGRMGRLSFQRTIDQLRWFVLIPQFCRPVTESFLEMLELKSGINTSGAGFVHSPPRKEFIDPDKEIRAIKAAVRNGFQSQSEAIRQFGFDPDDVLTEIKDFNKKLDKHGITLDTDPRKVSGAGNLTEVSNDDE